MFAVIDRIEDTAAGERRAVLVFDDGQRLTVPLMHLPSGSREGQILAVSWAIDAAETDRRLARVYALQRDVLGDLPPIKPTA